MGGAPALIEGFGHLQAVLRDTSLSGAERELVGLTVSHANTCAYSMAAHSTFAARHGLPAEVVNALRAGLPLPDEAAAGAATSSRWTWCATGVTRRRRRWRRRATQTSRCSR
jgi:AhpD family alkylhydroperoxidase